jgi:peroxiredoxin
MSKSRLVPFLFVASGALAGCNHSPEAARPHTQPPARPPLELALPTVDGDVFRISSLRGKVVLLNFFATWCVPCQEIFKRLLQVQSALGRDKVAIVAVSVDRHQSLVKPFVDALHLPFPVLLSTPSMLQRVGIGKVRIVPTTVVLDPRGRPRHIHSQMVSSRTLGRQARALLGE